MVAALAEAQLGLRTAHRTSRRSSGRRFHEYAEAPFLVINCSAIVFVEQGGDLADPSTRSGA